MCIYIHRCLYIRLSRSTCLYIYIDVYVQVYIYLGRFNICTLSAHNLVAIWPLQDIVLLGGVCARINHPFIAPSHLHCPHYCNTIALLLRNRRHPPTALWNAIHYTILVMTISCKGQVAMRADWPRRKLHWRGLRLPCPVRLSDTTLSFL